MKIQVNENIVLRQIQLSDALDIFSTIDSQREYLGKWLPFVEYTTGVEFCRNYISSILEVPEESREYVFVIHFNDVFAGLIGFKSTDRQNKKTEIGYWLSESCQKKGIITESVKTLMKFAFNSLDINRIQIKCAVGNLRSENIPVKLGFKFEGIERHGELLTGGKFADIKVYSKLKSEYV